MFVGILSVNKRDNRDTTSPIFYKYTQIYHIYLYVHINGSFLKLVHTKVLQSYMHTSLIVHISTDASSEARNVGDPKVFPSPSSPPLRRTQGRPTQPLGIWPQKAQVDFDFLLRKKWRLVTAENNVSCPVSPCHLGLNVSDSSWDFRCPLTPLNPCCPPFPVWRLASSFHPNGGRRFFPRPQEGSGGRRLHTEKKSTKVEATKSMEAASWKMYQSQSKAFSFKKKNTKCGQNNN